MKNTESQVLHFAKGDWLNVTFFPIASHQEYLASWQWLGHPPMCYDRKGHLTDGIGDCYGRASGQMVNGKRHGNTYLWHYSLRYGICQHKRDKDQLTWSDFGGEIPNNNWVCVAKYIHGKMVGTPKQHPIVLNYDNPKRKSDPSAPMTFSTLPLKDSTAIVSHVKCWAGGNGIPAIIE